jgi:transglutaminase-like putative cysteine protease
MTAIPPAAATHPARHAQGTRTGASRPEAWLLRLATFAGLGLFGGVHWAGIVRPGAGGDLLGLFLIAIAAGVVAAAASEVLTTRRRRTAAMVAIVLAALALILLVAGVPLWYLRPDRWDTLSVNLADAIGALPDLRMPYRGSDPWVRAVLIAGGGVLLLAGAILALAPRPRTLAATLCLGVLYVVAIIEHRPSHPYLDGVLFSLLLGAMLWGERLTDRETPVAATIALVAILGSALLAPHLDSPKPWVDYEALAEALQGGKTTTFTWNHSYGPVDWPRDGVEVARVRARGELYLKTANLEAFDGREWRQDKGVLSDGEDTQFAPRHPRWTQTIHVTVKGLKSRQFLVAGTTTLVDHSSKDVAPATPGTFQASGKPLRRGDAYDALVYVPAPSTIEMQAAGTDYPSYVIRQLALQLPSQPGVGPLEVHIAPWGSDAAGAVRAANGFAIIDAEHAFAASPYAREYALAQQIRNATTDPYDFVRKVIARVQRDARYTESPPSPGRLAPLDAFLFRDHAGYCQHFAGATALLLRMGGVPARVVAGFSPGSRDGATHVIRDLDAHSWVEVYFPQIGWVTFDPTPGDSPARSQQTDTVLSRSAIPASRKRPSPAGDRLSDPQAGGAAAATGGGGGDVGLWLALGGVALALIATTVGAAVLRRRRLARSDDPDLEELRIALRRSGRGIVPGLTLAKLERMLHGGDGAGSYVASLRVARYGAGGSPPTPRQRRALRRELAAGLGVGGRIRALWALPPRSAELWDALRPRRRRSYN